MSDKHPRFRDVSARVDLPALDARILAFWKEHGIFEKSLEGRDDAPIFVFYEGPPTANGRPGAHHVISRIFKDLFPRYKTMRGYRVPRKAGWDTHGLPVEVEVCKELGIHSKEEIEEYGTKKKIRYDPEMRIGVGISKIGTSKAIAIGAYAFALNSLDSRDTN